MGCQYRNEQHRCISNVVVWETIKRSLKYWTKTFNITLKKGHFTFKHSIYFKYFMHSHQQEDTPSTKVSTWIIGWNNERTGTSKYECHLVLEIKIFEKKLINKNNLISCQNLLQLICYSYIKFIPNCMKLQFSLD